MLANGVAMQAIMQAAQEETKISRVLATKAQKLSESMKEDSLSMRTVSTLNTINKEAMTKFSKDSSMYNALPTGDVIRSRSLDAIF